MPVSPSVPIINVFSFLPVLILYVRYSAALAPNFTVSETFDMPIYASVDAVTVTISEFAATVTLVPLTSKPSYTVNGISAASFSPANVPSAMSAFFVNVAGISFASALGMLTSDKL